MFRGKAELVSPETGGTVATFSESCSTEGSATAKFVLEHAIELKDNERLEIFGTVKDVPVISVGATNPTASKIYEFSGKSAVGCLPDKTEITLVKNTGWSTWNPSGCSGNWDNPPSSLVSSYAVAMAAAMLPSRPAPSEAQYSGRRVVVHMLASIHLLRSSEGLF